MRTPVRLSAPASRGSAQAASPSRLRPSASASATSPLAQLAEMAASSHVVQAQFDLARDIAESPQVAQQAALAAAMSPGPVVQRGGGQSTPDESSIYETEYGKLVVEAAEKLKGKIGFGASPEGKFDTDHWEKIEDAKYRFAIRTTSKPSVAVKAMFDHPEKWSFDCAEFVQVCNIYATIKLYETDEIDKQPLVLRQHDSTTQAGGGVEFMRDAKGSKFDGIFPKSGNAYKGDLLTEEELMSGVPVGARVCFKNPAAPDTPFRNENAVVTGKGVFAAHPMGTGLSAQDIIDKLVSYNQQKGLGGEDYGRSLIFISQVTISLMLPMSNSTIEKLKLTPYKKHL